MPARPQSCTDRNSVHLATEHPSNDSAPLRRLRALHGALSARRLSRRLSWRGSPPGPSGAAAGQGQVRSAFRFAEQPQPRTTGESPELGPPGRGLVKSHEELRLTVGNRPRVGPLGEQLTPGRPGSAVTENRSGRLVSRYVPPHRPGHQNALQGRGVVPPGTSDQPPDPGAGSSPSVLVRQRHLASIVRGPQGVPPPVLTSTASGGTDSRKGSCAPQGYPHFSRYGGSLFRVRRFALPGA